MYFCEYGCGKEAKYKNKIGRWQCAEFWQQCPVRKKEAGIISKKTHNTKEFKKKAKINALQQFKNETNKQRKDRIDKIKEVCNTTEFKEAARIRSIELWKDEDLRKQMMSSMKKDSKQKKVLSKIAIKRFKKETKKQKSERIKKAKLGSKRYFENESNKKRQHRINSKKRTIKKIKKKYSIFYQVEEMRYEPGKEKERLIQVRCKNNKCKNSKELDGWFTSTNRQLEQRIAAIELPNGNDGLYFYCSEECKQECELFNLHEDPNRLNEYQKYSIKVYKITHNNLKLFKNKIQNLHLRGWKYGYDLDHRFSIYDGFNQNIDPEIIGHYKNLEIIKASKNRSKNKKSSITLNELLNKIKEL